MANQDYAFLDSVSEHRNRLGDTSNMNPEFAARLSSAIRQAQAAGLPVKVMSAYRDDNTTGSKYDREGHSAHGYGLATDIDGLDGPNGKITKQWAEIAAANGIHNPYGVGNKTEFNHWQLPEKPLEQTPELLQSLQAARATGDFKNVWNAYAQSAGGAARANSGQSGSNGAQPVDFRNSVYQTLVGKGLTPKQAMGAMYSLMGESGTGLDPGSFNPKDPGGAMGFAQWVGPRRAGLQSVAKAMGVSETDPSAQLAYFNQELEGPYKKVIDNIKANANSSADATKIWTQDFEAPKVNNWQARYAGGAKVASLGDDDAPIWSTPATTTPGAATPAPASAPKPGFPTSVGDAIAKLTATDEKTGRSALDNLGDSLKPRQAAVSRSSPMLQAPPESGGNMQAAQALLQTTLAAQAKPLSWTTTPWGTGVAGPQGVG